MEVLIKLGLILSFPGIIFNLSSKLLNSKLKKYCYRNINNTTKVYQEKYRLKFINDFNAERHKIKTEDGIVLDAFVVKRLEAKRTILMIHGYRQSKEHLYNLVKLFDKDNIVLIDLRAHGLSEGDLISWGYQEYKDVNAAVEYIKTRKDLISTPIIAMGYSMGSISLLKAAAKGLNINAIILDSGFSDLSDQLKYMVCKKHRFMNLLFVFIKRCFNAILDNAIDKLKPYQLINNINIPIFILHSKADKVVPVNCAYELYNNIKSDNYKDIWIVEDSNHIKAFEDYSQEYKDRVIDFINKSLKKINEE